MATFVVSEVSQAPERIEQYGPYGLLMIAVIYLYRRGEKIETNYKQTLAELKQEKDTEIKRLQERIAVLEAKFESAVREQVAIIQANGQN